jgi:flagellin
MLQIADGTLQSLSEGTDKLNQLSIRMNSGLLNDSQKSALSKEFDAIGRTMQRSVDNASFNGKPLFGSDFDFSLGNSSTGTSLGSFDTSTLDINSQESIAAFSKVVQEQMIEVGSTTNALYSSSNSIIANISATAAAQSQMSDSDITKNVGDFSQADIMSKIAINAQTHQMDRLQSQMSVLVG